MNAVATDRRSACVSRRSKNRSGFTLIEVLIVVAIMAILAATAAPGYQRYVERGHRAEARAALMQAAQWMERVATATGVYPATSESSTPLPVVLSSVPGKRYTISLKASTSSTYTLLAIPQGAQLSDSCATLTLNQAGVRGVTVDGAGRADLISACWNR